MMHECEAAQEGDGGVMWYCTAQAVGKWKGYWYCSEHLDEQMKERGLHTEMPESDTFL